MSFDLNAKSRRVKLGIAIDVNAAVLPELQDDSGRSLRENLPRERRNPASTGQAAKRLAEQDASLRLIGRQYVDAAKQLAGKRLRGGGIEDRSGSFPPSES